MRLLLTGCLLAAGLFAADRQVAITIDDLPVGGSCSDHDPAGIREMTTRLLRPFHDLKAPFTGFVNQDRCRLSSADLRAVLGIWLDMGGELGNHTATHPSFNRTDLAPYLADVEAGESTLRPFLTSRGHKLRYFRHPFLQAGNTPEKKRGLNEWLAGHGYTIAPVTLDNSDYMYAAIYTKALAKGDTSTAQRALREYVPYMESVVEFFEKRSVEITGSEFPQVLLIHANPLNAAAMPDLLAMFRRRGYRIVSLEQALKHPAYSQPEEYVGTGGFSWIHRWSKTKGMSPKGEPDPPEWVQKGWQ